jgi:hypothetical protein
MCVDSGQSKWKYPFESTRLGTAPGCDRSPTIENALARQREMKSKINLGVRFCIAGYFRKPRTRHHDACGVYETGFKAFDRGGVHGMCHAEVIGVNDQEFCVARVAQSLR